MHIVFLGHPSFLPHQSMPRFLTMLHDGMQKKGHTTEIWSPDPYFFLLSKKNFLKKWFGYIDQYVIFPLVILAKILFYPSYKKSLFVFTDQALGPWVPMLSRYKHVIHCHDFLALRSALGEIPENPTGKTGALYQSFIRKGFSKGKNFISVSKHTQRDLHTYYLGSKIDVSHVVYNGLNQQLTALDKKESLEKMETYSSKSFPNGYVMHIGGNSWYKNRVGIVELYGFWQKKYKHSIPLLLIGQAPDEILREAIKNSGCEDYIHVLVDLPNEWINIAYSGSKLLLFPSLAEGFGWPIAEGLAAGTVVLTTNEAPMTEVGADAAFYIDRYPHELALKENWLYRSSSVLEQITQLSSGEYNQRIKAGIIQVSLLSNQACIDSIEKIYHQL